jgi:hypothetical protein
MWQIIYKEVGKSSQTEQKIELNSVIGKITNSRNVTEMLNSFFQELQMNL